MDKPTIELKNVRKVYGTTIQTEALKGINLTINKGEFVSIIGPSGSGKSTLLNIMGTLDTLTSGSYLLDGTALENLSQNELAEFRNRKIGFVFQFHHLLPAFTALENVLMPYWIRKTPVTKEIIRQAESYLDVVGVLNRKDYKAGNLSGGQQQRIALARALINQPSMILADEPTGNLDSEATEQVYGLLRKINREQKTTFVIVTHDRHLAVQADRIIEVLDGNILRDEEITTPSDSHWKEFSPVNCFLRTGKMPGCEAGRGCF